MTAVVDSLKAYYRNKEENPWHRTYKDIQGEWNKTSQDKDISEYLVLLREAVFGALDILSFGLIQEISTLDVLELLTSETSWTSGRRKARNLCLDIADELIKRGEVRYLLTSALERDGFGFLVPRVEEAQWKNFIDARPKIARKKLDLSKLEASILGSNFLRDQMVMETKLDSDDSRVAAILEAYDRQLVEIEVDWGTKVGPLSQTDQVTLNGEVVRDTDDERESTSKKRKQKEDVIPLTEFLENSSKTNKSTKATDKKTKGSGRLKSK
jgi:hypothetical protein